LSRALRRFACVEMTCRNSGLGWCDEGEVGIIALG
jgi:hypothetical protein